MRLVFAGTPEFSVAALDALHAAGHEIAGVYTQPDRPAGRGRRLSASPVALRAEALGLPVFKPARLRGDDAAVAELAALRPEVMVVVAYGLILPQNVLDIPTLGCLNIHASLLPRWRGAAPIQRAILAGDTHTGVTIMRMDAGLDTGPMLLWKPVAITPQTTGGLLHDELAVVGADLIVEAVARLGRAELPDHPQPAEGVSYASKFGKDDARIDWRESAGRIDRLIRAFDPVPGAWTQTQSGERVKILRASLAALQQASGAEPGTVLSAEPTGILVATGTADSAMRIESLQFAGGKALSARQASGRLEPGTRLLSEGPA